MKKKKIISIGIILFCCSIRSVFSQSLWHIAKENKDILVVTTLFTAHDIRNYLSNPAELENAVKWCKQTGITKVYLESFRDGYQVDRQVLENAKKRFLSEGFEVWGCVTTTRHGKSEVGRGWGSGSCYSDEKTQKGLQKIFEYTASIFDHIMIDDFLFTECECEQCIASRCDYSWTKFRCDKMVEMSRERILKPAKKINPNVKITIKYPNWYDDFQQRGYDVFRQTQDFDNIYVGTETRDYDYSIRSSGEVQYGAYFNMRWLGVIGGKKTGGGWFDALGTTANTYLEQARQTVLGGAKELMLFSYGDLIRETNIYNGWMGTPVANIKAFREELPGLFKLAKIIHNKEPKGVDSPKLANSEPYEESYIYSFMGMLGIPLKPVHEINKQLQAAFFPVQMLKQFDFSTALRELLEESKPIVVTDGLAKRLKDQSLLTNKNLRVLEIKGEPKNLLKLGRKELDSLRNHLLEPFGIYLNAPLKVGLYLFEKDCLVMENFNDELVDVELIFSHITKAQKLLILPRENEVTLSSESNVVKLSIMPRTLVVIKY